MGWQRLEEATALPHVVEKKPRPCRTHIGGPWSSSKKKTLFLFFCDMSHDWLVSLRLSLISTARAIGSSRCARRVVLCGNHASEELGRHALKQYRSQRSQHVFGGHRTEVA